MADHSIPELRITVENENEDLRSLLRIIKPTWKEDAVKIENLSGGFSCRMFRCYDDADPENSVSVRVRNLLARIIKLNEGSVMEMTMIEYMSKKGHFPKIHASFGNGYCYQYIKGNPIMQNRKREILSLNNDIFVLVAKELAFIHSIKLDDQEYTSDKCFQFYTKLLNAIPEGSFPSKEMLTEEFKFLRKYFESKDFRIIICHGDPNFGNIIYNKEKGNVTFIDWELAGYGYQLFELAQIIMNVEYIEVFAAMKSQEFPLSPGYQRCFVRQYIDALNKLDDNGQQTTEEELDKLMEEIELFRMGVLLFFLSFPLVMKDIMEEAMDDLEMFKKQGMEKYLKLKEKAFGKNYFEADEN